MTFDSAISLVRSGVYALRASAFLTTGFWLTTATVAGGVLGYVYQVLMGRMLAPADFALFSAVMALSMFFASPLGAMLIVISRRVSTLRAHLQFEVLRKLYLRSHQYVVIGGAIFLLLLTPFVDFAQLRLKSDDATPVWAFAIILFFSALLVINTAYFQGLQSFGRLGSLGVFSVAVKILLSATLVYFGLGVNGALSGALLATAFTWLFGLGLLLRSLPVSENPEGLVIDGFSFRSYAPVIVASVAFAAMTQLDMVIVNWYFSREEAGLYAAASVLGKAVLYLPGGIVMALFPMVAENHAREESSAAILKQSIVVTASLGGSAAVIYWFLGDWLIEIFYGPAYSGAGALLRWYGFAILPITLVMVAEYFLIAKGRVLFAWIFLAMAPIQLIAFVTWHETAWMILAVMGVCGAVVATLGYAMLWRDYRSVRAQDSV